MSVAFRREGDEEHKEPRFELPIPPGPNRVTPRGLRLIAEAVATLEARLRDAGDEGAREAVARDLRYWRTRHVTAEVAPVPAGDTVALGTRATIRVDGRERTVRIVGHDEADPATGRLAFTAPLARALLGAAAGEEVAFAGREDAVAVLAVAADDDARA